MDWFWTSTLVAYSYIMGSIVTYYIMKDDE